MRAENRIRRHGYHLMSLASVGIFCVALFGLLLMGLPWLSDWQPQASTWSRVAHVEWGLIRDMGTTGRRLLSLAFALWTLGYLLPLVALRRLGSALHRHEALSRPVARAFAWLAHSLPAYALLVLAQELLVAVACEIEGVRQIHVEADFGGIYLFLVACLCLYSVAHLMRLATEAADDARSIV
ncbi:hypothetical protein [Pseudoxanthomonas suwonensis]|jgi:hypothetical protein|uniref:hypothetical protein n=1 Tax=Pseudoxanthomonas suwonensis TaxID=314722 RepID=UPI000463E142|nr:hypothetical protein [Pseudoxanthomonas suwonensis]